MSCLCSSFVGEYTFHETLTCSWFRDFIPLKFDVALTFRSKLPIGDCPTRSASPVQGRRHFLEHAYYFNGIVFYGLLFSEWVTSSFFSRIHDWCYGVQWRNLWFQRSFNVARTFCGTFNEWEFRELETFDVTFTIIHDIIYRFQSPTVEDEIIDPLLHADLYEEVTRADKLGFDLISSSQPSSSTDESPGILKHLPLDVCRFLPSY